MIAAQLAFDFDAPVKSAGLPRGKASASQHSALKNDAERARIAAYWAERAIEARSYWRVGMVTALPCMAEIEGIGRRYSMMLPAVVESIDGDLASARIYAAPEWGYTLESYPLHLQRAINVQLHELSQHHGHRDLQWVVDQGLLTVGSAELAARVRAGVQWNRALAASI